MTRLVDVTPEMACRWLQAAKRGSGGNETKTHAYAAAMRAGEWEPERYPVKPVRWHPDGLLRNGHHRLYAVVRCGLTVPMWVSGSPP